MDPPIRFYVPDADPRTLPQRLEDYWPWIRDRSSLGEIGRYTWTVKTCLYLKEAGLPVDLTAQLPSQGMVIAHRDFVPMILRPRTNLFLVCIKPDRKEHPWAHYYVVQNEGDPVFKGGNRHRSVVVSHWPQGLLVVRRDDRGTRVENVRYYGRSVNLAGELATEAWSAHLASRGLSWRIVPSQQWHDYSDADVTVSIRVWSPNEHSRDPLLNPDSKPPSKLINSWLAGVPAIVGKESAFRRVRKGPLDYIEVGSIAELTAAIERLRSDGTLYRAMVENGRSRATEFSADAVLGEWQNLVRHRLLPAYERWMARPRFVRQTLNIGRTAAFFLTPRNIAGIRLYRE